MRGRRAGGGDHGGRPHAAGCTPRQRGPSPPKTVRAPPRAAPAPQPPPPARRVVGFGLDRGYALEDFTADAEVEGLVLVQRFSSWALRPASDDFLVGVLEHG